MEIIEMNMFNDGEVLPATCTTKRAKRPKPFMDDLILPATCTTKRAKRPGTLEF